MDTLIYEVIAWSSKGDPKDVDKWLHFCERYLKLWKWNKKAIQDFLDWGEMGGFNNKLLHVETDLNTFYGEVHYSSDRMSLDRLFRCHVAYRTLKR